MDLIIDIGNTKAKIAVFDDARLVLRRSWTNLSVDRIEKLIKDGTVDKIIARYAPFKGAVISATDSLGVDIQ